MFDCPGFIKAVLKQNRTKIRSCFADDAVISAFFDRITVLDHGIRPVL